MQFPFLKRLPNIESNIVLLTKTTNIESNIILLTKQFFDMFVSTKFPIVLLHLYG